MLNINSKGLLTPNTYIQSDIEELKRIFVDEIRTTKRTDLFNQYTAYSKALKELCGGGNLKQWIDGSFVTQKPEPNDIDIVTFIHYSIVDDLGAYLGAYKSPSSRNNFAVDGYIVKVYPENHKYNLIFKADKAYWIDHFNKTRRNRFGNKLPKGFLEINM